MYVIGLSLKQSLSSKTLAGVLQALGAGALGFFFCAEALQRLYLGVLSSSEAGS